MLDVAAAFREAGSSLCDGAILVRPTVNGSDADECVVTKVCYQSCLVPYCFNRLHIFTGN